MEGIIKLSVLALSLVLESAMLPQVSKTERKLMYIRFNLSFVRADLLCSELGRSIACARI